MQLWNVDFCPKGGYGNGMFIVLARTAQEAENMAEKESCYEGTFGGVFALDDVKLAANNTPHVVTYSVYIP